MFKKILALLLLAGAVYSQSFISNFPELPRATQGTDVIPIEDTNKTYKITFDSLKSAIRPYKSYVAVLTQSGTFDPVVTVVHNEIGAIVWTRVSEGTYQGILANAFTLNKTITLDGGSLRMMQIKPSNANIIQIDTRDVDGNLVDTQLSSTSIEIRVYE